jgi:membrane protein DedA with SNARE-associated domain
MDTLAHALWAGAGAMVLGRRGTVSAATSAAIVSLAVLPDVPHLMPMLAWVLSGDAPISVVRDILVATPGTEPAMPAAVHELGRQLYFIMHSAIVAAAVTGLAWALLRAFPVALLGWWSHIVIDVFTHSRDFYPVEVFFPLGSQTFDGLAWNTPWFLALNYLLLAQAYLWLFVTRRRTGAVAHGMSLRTRGIAAAVVIAASAGTVVFGLRSYHSLLLLRSAYELGVPTVSAIRPWMTIGYLAATHHTPTSSLIERLGLPPDTDPATDLGAIARRTGVARFDYVQQVQRAVAGMAPAPTGNAGRANSAWISAVGEWFLSAVLVYGYLALAIVLLLGAIGAPLPTGLAVLVAGSLSAAGKFSWSAAALIAFTASVAGDVAGFGIGRLASREFLERRGRWLGYTPARQARVEVFFRRWGGFGVLLSRTLISSLSSIVNVVAGASHYRLDRFVLLSVVGRVAWTCAYLGLGYAVGTDLDAASSFLANLSLLLVCLVPLAGMGLFVARRSTMASPVAK